MMLPHVVRFNEEDGAARSAYAEMAIGAGLVERGSDPVDALISRLKCCSRQPACPDRSPTAA